MNPREAVDAAYERIAADGRDGIWLSLVDRSAALAAAARATGPLAGRTLAVKGNIDLAGLRTTAGCPSYGSVAERSATVVRRLEAAGAIVVGSTNLDQFATGLVGTRSPYGVCPNAWWPELVSGGSSSGSAVAVAAGLVDLALGTDTAGSGRVPAAANGIVGLKPTRGRLSTAGVVPACASLDCVSVFARSVDEAALAADVATAFDHADPWSRRADPSPVVTQPRIGRTPGLDVPGLDVDLEPFLAAGALLYEGAFVAERYAAVGEFVASGAEGLDPVVASIILAARDLPAWQLARDHTELERLRRLTEPVWADIDVLVVPSVPRIPTVAEVLADPIGANSALGTYTNFVNLLDLCALTIPVGPPTPEAPPPSVTLIAPAWSDQLLVEVARDLCAVPTTA
ncbi:MAG: amidase [Actinomycetia bacterium]|nr:amidase [Actinomycetes bacterium]